MTPADAIIARNTGRTYRTQPLKPRDMLGGLSMGAWTDVAVSRLDPYGLTRWTACSPLLAAARMAASGGYVALRQEVRGEGHVLRARLVGEGVG